MTTLYIPTGGQVEVEKCSLTRLAFEYRQVHFTDRETLEILAKELERREELQAEMVRALLVIDASVLVNGGALSAAVRDILARATLLE